MIVKINAFLEAVKVANPMVIAGYSWGDFYKKWSGGNIEYPHMNAFSATKTMSKGVTSIDLTISLSDIVRNDESNLFEVENSTMNALRDVWNLFKAEMQNENITVNEQTTLTFFQNNGGDNVAGHYFVLNLTSYDEQSICTDIMGVGAWQPPAFICKDAEVKNSDASYFQLIPSGGSLTLPDNMITDSDGTIKTIPAQTPFVCMPQLPITEIDLTVNLAPFLNGLTTDQNISLKDQNGNDITPVINGNELEVYIAPPCPDSQISISGTYISDLPSGDSLNIITTDQNDVVITPISGTVSGGVATVKVNIPVCPPDTKQWTLQFLTGNADITAVANIGNIATFASGSGTGIGTLTISTDGITYGAISYPFTPISGTTYYFKRSTTAGFAEYKMIE